MCVGACFARTIQTAPGGTFIAHPHASVHVCVVGARARCLLQVLLWYASLYIIFLLAYGGGSSTWRYGLDVQKAKPAGALLLVPLVVFIFFCLW